MDSKYAAPELKILRGSERLACSARVRSAPPALKGFATFSNSPPTATGLAKTGRYIKQPYST